MVSLRFLVVLGITLAAALAVPDTRAQDADSIVAEGVAIDKNRAALFHFRLGSDDRITIDDLGPMERPPDPENGFPVIPDSAIATLNIPFTTLNLIANQASAARSDTRVRRFGFAVESKRLRIQFDQGLPLWIAASVTLALLLLGGGIAAGLLIYRQRERRVREEATRQRTFHAREAERSRLAREIHDGPLQDVHALRLLTGAQAAEVVESEAGRIARDLRAIAEGLRPPALGRFGLAAALAAHTRRIKERHPNLHFDLDLEENGAGPDTLSEIVRSALFRIAQEAITNATEHGDATRIRLQLQFSEDDCVTLTISDNGSGLDETMPDLETLADGGHFGLIGMHERADALGGRLALTPDGLDGRGVRVQVTAPIAPSAYTLPVIRRLLPA